VTSHIIVFQSAADMPSLPMSVGTTLYNKTGSWRYVRPVYRDKTPPCNHACPAGEDIVDYLQMVVDGNYEQARQRILEENPLIGVCGRVCPHPCESDCNRTQLGGAIAIHALERFVAGQPGARRLPQAEKTAPAGAQVAVVGSGPAGLSCAYQLARRGYKVTIFEALPAAGGMLRVGIPSYRLPREVLDAEIAAIQALGVEIRTGMRLGQNPVRAGSPPGRDGLRLEDLAGYRAVFLAVGQHLSRRLGIPGEEAQGVLPGLEFLRRVNLGEPVQIGSRVAVVGGGNTAMDAARCAVRQGARQVTILYRRSRHEMPAIDEEIEETEGEGVKVQYLTAPVEVVTTVGKVTALKCMRMKLGEPDEGGRRKPEPIHGSEYSLPVDMVIPALGQEADLSFLDSQIDSARGLIVIDAAGATSRQSVFAGGDAATGRSAPSAVPPRRAAGPNGGGRPERGAGTVAYAIGSGKRAALAIDRLLNGQSLEGFPALGEHVHVAARDVDPRVVPFEDINLAYFSSEPRTPQGQRTAAERVKDFQEVNLGFSEREARREAERCLSCGTCNQCDTCWLYCPDVCIRRRDHAAPPGPGHTAYEFDYDYCKGCGVCAQECPREAIDMEEELKWRR
jgi:2-oxoacid:acceptor oxidoreductase delta subunit (pyruvate/2-ketoisovalerate family)